MILRKHIKICKGLLAGFWLGVFVFQGCSAVPKQTDFIASSELAPCPEDSSLLWWESPGSNWHHYNKVMLDPLSIRIDMASSDRKFSPDELKVLNNEFEVAVIKRLRPEYPVVRESGPNVLRIRAAVTDIDTSYPFLNIMTTAIFLMPLDMGGASIEVEFLDSMTGERLAAMADRKAGTPLAFKSAFTRFGHTRKAFEQWAEELKSALANNP